MNPATKFTVTMVAGVLIIILLLAMVPSLFSDVQDQPATDVDTGSAGVGDQMWIERNADMLVLAVTIFAGVLGVLALAAGGFKWH